jgi:retinol-binding protein 3
MHKITSVLQSSAIAAALLAGACALTASADDASERSLLVAAVADALQSEYVYPELAAKMGDALRAHAKHGDYAAIGDGAALADKLTADLRAVSHDRHLSVGLHADGARSEPEGAPSIEDMQRWREDAARDNFGFRKVERMDGNIGYLDFRSFVEPYLSADTASAAMAFVANADALIIDLRQNGGGEPEMVARMASYLFDTRTHLNDIYMRRGDRLEQYWTTRLAGPAFGGRKPLDVLTSKATFSAAEDFTYALKNLKRGVIVGETTGGGAHPTRAIKVSEHFAVAVPFARSISPITHTDWEGAGVAPDLAVPAADALRTAYRAALQRILAATRDAKRKQELEALLASQKPR